MLFYCNEWSNIKELIMSESDIYVEGYLCDWFFFDFKLAHIAVLCFILKDQLKYDLFM